MLSLPDFKYKQCLFFSPPTTNHAKLKFKADNIVVEDNDGKVLLQHSCHRIFALFIVGNISLTNVALKKAKKFAFPVLLLSRNLRLYTYFNNRAEGNFLIRKRQYTAGCRNVEIAKQIVKQKICNQTTLLKSLRQKANADKEAIRQLEELNPESATSSKELLGIEGTASKFFFAAYFRPLNWVRREPRTKRDIANLLLDIGYTYLFHFIEAMTALYGFDVYCGFYHTFFYQRKSLICDLVEPFRCIIDQRLRKSYKLGQIDENDFFMDNHQYHLSYKKQGKYTKIFFKEILKHKEEIFLFIQSYYRWFMKDKPISDFPEFSICGER